MSSGRTYLIAAIGDSAINVQECECTALLRRKAVVLLAVGAARLCDRIEIVQIAATPRISNNGQERSNMESFRSLVRLVGMHRHSVTMLHLLQCDNVTMSFVFGYIVITKHAKLDIIIS